MRPLGFYRALLRCYPAPFREEYGAEMTFVFAEQIRTAREQGDGRAEASVWLRAFSDLLHIAPKEHLHVIRQDLRYAVRTFAANPGFTAVATLSLALGIGANTAIFSLLNSVLLSALPVPDPHELVMLTDPESSGDFVGSQRGERSLLTYPEFRQLRDESEVFRSLTASQSSLMQTEVRVDGGEAERVRLRMVSAEYFDTLGVPALLGRTFTAEDDVEGASPHAVISYDFWQRRFGRRADILGVPLALRGGVFSIVGVVPASFFGETVGERPDAWLPLSMQATVLPGRDWLHAQPGSVEKAMWLHVFGRLRPGTSIEQAEAAVNVVFQQALASYYASQAPEDRKRFLDQRLKLRPAATGASQVRGQFSEPLFVLLAGAGIVLLIACANIGNLLLTRTTARSREIAVRLALGASRGRLVRQLLTESAVLAFLGGAAGLAAAVLLREGLLRLVSESIVLSAAPDVRVLVFAFGLTLLVGLVLGGFPALRAVRVDATAGLRERGPAGSAGWMRTGKFVVVGQIALSLPLLVGAGLLLQTLYNLQDVDLGYAKERLLIVEVDAETAGYEPSRREPLYERIFERIRATPGVSAVAYSFHGLFSGSDSGDQITVEGYAPTGDNDGGSRYSHVGPGYFSALGIPLLVGREITESDQSGSDRVCVINEAFGKKFFTDRNPIGLHVTQTFGDQSNTFRVVGVVRDVRERRLRDEIPHRFYVPAAQFISPPGTASFAVRTSAASSGVFGSIRRVLGGMDSNLPIVRARPLEELVNGRLVQDRLLARLSIAFGAAALLLAAIGLYGVLSYGVARRANEIGIRKALGARHGAVTGMVLRETGRLLMLGLVAGAALSAMGIRLITSRLYGLAPADPLAFTVSVAMLAVVGLAAAGIPAYRAARVDPLVALRHE